MSLLPEIKCEALDRSNIHDTILLGLLAFLAAALVVLVWKGLREL